MAVAARQIRPRRPSAFDRFLQILGTGVNIAGTVKGIQQSGQRLELSRAAGVLAEGAAKREEARDIANIAERQERSDVRLRGQYIAELKDGRVQDFVAEYFRNPEALTLDAKGFLDIMSQIPDPGSEETFASALIAQDAIGREQFMDPVNGAFGSSTTYDSAASRNPRSSQALRQIRARNMTRAGVPTLPEDISGSDTIHLGATSFGDIASAFKTQFFQANPQLIPAYTSLMLGRELGGNLSLPETLALAKAEGDATAGETVAGLESGSPVALEGAYAKLGYGLPETEIWDFTATDPEFARFMKERGINIGDRMELTIRDKNKLVLAGFDDWMALKLQKQTKRSGFTDAITEKILSSGLVPTGRADLAEMAGNGSAEFYDVAVELGERRSQAEWEADPERQFSKRVAVRFREIRAVATALPYITGLEQFSPLGAMLDFFRDSKKDPFNNGDVEELIPILEELNRSAGFERFLIPKLTGGLLGHFRKVQLVGELEKNGMLSRDGEGRLVDPFVNQTPVVSRLLGATVGEKSPLAMAQKMEVTRAVVLQKILELPAENQSQAVEGASSLTAFIDPTTGEPVMLYTPEQATQLRSQFGVVVEEALVPEVEPTDQERIADLRQQVSSLQRVRAQAQAANETQAFENADKTIQQLEGEIETIQKELQASFKTAVVKGR